MSYVQEEICSYSQGGSMRRELYLNELLRKCLKSEEWKGFVASIDSIWNES